MHVTNLTNFADRAPASVRRCQDALPNGAREDALALLAPPCRNDRRCAGSRPRLSRSTTNQEGRYRAPVLKVFESQFYIVSPPSATMPTE